MPDTTTLVALPPYSPELNPVERVWLHLMERFLSHRLHADYDAIAEALCAAWSRLLAKPHHEPYSGQGLGGPYEFRMS